ncbi:tRNA uridine-5-carboxymethylaminomethyl(34) synthesis GTPase MnmE [Rhodopila sp.]|jgi:tRNA modification GTPase|uniref:tRNA uridine-5-carboxymethylaminomethyl(34) synthesis GTPase MnmE n=1 Tax=Rhodopila sp. TaxID=2480087 RepID=UPI002C4A7EF7|nr:tRNA uridine-5-carboxymethylaminomethyl(34) synthesis GTPase MnmE [Rhodopila sp.]HVZ10360.1 tRNA uridine-5-carboxymethylaminomethyl(34) synthesis GTPase MnmE [Rhodopila sp.]
MTAETIFALASGAGRAAIAVMRISGPRTAAVLAALCGGALPPPRQASLRRLRDGKDGTLDRALVLWLPGPRTYTGEDAAELHLHGGRAVIEAVAHALAEAGLRPAEPGEFTRRAFLNGRLDLIEAEAINDLIEAETDAQRRQALRQLDGALGALYRGWSDRLRTVLAHQEALIDFPDEDLPPEVDAALLATLRAVRDDIRRHLDDAGRGEKLREGLHFAITGAPNVGKSTLINALAERDVAIVSDIPGTTRDVLEARVVLGGVPVTLADTAGLRQTEDAIEAEGVRRARARARDADLVIHLVEAGANAPADLPASHVLVATKADLGGNGPDGALRISARSGEGMDGLRDRLAQAARAMTETDGPPPLTRARHRAALLAAAALLDAAETAALPELRGEDLRLAMRELGRITGHVGVEDLLDTIFSAFCIGK